VCGINMLLVSRENVGGIYIFEQGFKPDSSFALKSGRGGGRRRIVLSSAGRMRGIEGKSVRSRSHARSDSCLEQPFLEQPWLSNRTQALGLLIVLEKSFLLSFAQKVTYLLLHHQQSLSRIPLSCSQMLE
jgi:hypothetical protein